MDPETNVPDYLDTKLDRLSLVELDLYSSRQNTCPHRGHYPQFHSNVALYLRRKITVLPETEEKNLVVICITSLYIYIYIYIYICMYIYIYINYIYIYGTT